MGEDRETESDADAIATALAEDRRAWPGIDVGADELAEYVRARLEPVTTGATFSDRIDGLHTADLFLACACARGDTAAIESFRRAFNRDLAALFARPDSRGTDREDLVQKLFERLFVAEGGKPPRITEYRGRGSMRTWLRVVALRVRLNAERRVSDKEDGLASQAEQRLGDGVDRSSTISRPTTATRSARRSPTRSGSCHRRIAICCVCSSCTACRPPASRACTTSTARRRSAGSRRSAIACSRAPARS